MEPAADTRPTREFDLGDILSITTDRLVSPRHIDGVYDILNFMTGDNLFTHQLPRAQDECRPRLLEQHPALALVDASEVTPDNWREWLAAQKVRLGETLSVQALASADHTRIHPLDEPNLNKLMAEGRVVVVETDE